jgi:hypothetical protein
LGLYRLQEATAGGHESQVRKLRMGAFQSCRALVRQSRKVAQYRTDAYRLMGRYYWLAKSPKRALRWWRKAIHGGNRLEARIQLARTYVEVGRRLLESDTRCTMLDGLEAQTYLEKAVRIFDELNLEWDLERLRSIPQRD